MSDFLYLFRVEMTNWRKRYFNLDFQTAASVAVLASLVTFYFLFGYHFFRMIFRFLHGEAPVGDILAERLLSLAALACWVLLIFSNTVTGFGKLYQENDLQLLLSQPLSHGAIFYHKLVKSLIAGCWSVLCLFLPLVVAYGVVYGASPAAFAIASLALLFYLVSAALPGILIAVVLARFFSASRSKWMVIAFGALCVLLSWGMVKLLGFSRMGTTEAVQVADQYIYTNFGGLWYQPGDWWFECLHACIQGRWSEAAFFLGLLASTAALFTLPIYWLIRESRIYQVGLTRSVRRAESKRRAEKDGYLKPQRLLVALKRILPNDVASLWYRELLLFVRTPTQWTQMIMLIALVIVYLVSCRNLPVDLQDPYWQNISGFVNLGLIGFVLATLAVRFVFPLVGQEGRAIWLCASSSFSRKRLFWSKYFLAAVFTIVLSQSLMLLSSLILGIEGPMFLLTICSALVMAIALTSLAHGVGATVADFRSENPTLIASSPGAVAALLLALLYVGVCITLLAWPVRQLIERDLSPAIFSEPQVRFCLTLMLFWSGLYVLLPLAFGSARLQQREL